MSNADRDKIATYLREVAELYKEAGREEVVTVLVVCARDIESNHEDTVPPRCGICLATYDLCDCVQTGRR